MGSNLLKFVALAPSSSESRGGTAIRGCRWIGAVRSSDVAIVAVDADVNRMCRGLARGSCSSAISSSMCVCVVCVSLTCFFTEPFFFFLSVPTPPPGRLRALARPGSGGGGGGGRVVRGGGGRVVVRGKLGELELHFATSCQSGSNIDNRG